MAEISSTGDNMLAVLDRIAEEGPLTVAEAARLCGLNRTVTHRLLTTLSKRSYVRRTDDGYALGPTIVRYGRIAEVGLKEIAEPIMARLSQSTGETVVLHVQDRNEAVVLDQSVGTRHLVRVEHVPGSRHPLCRGASGWAILSFLPERVSQRVFRAFGQEATGPERLRKVKEDGFAVSFDELQLGVHGIAAPVFDAEGDCQASLGVLVPTARATNIERFREELLASARQLSSDLALGGSKGKR